MEEIKKLDFNDTPGKAGDSVVGVGEKESEVRFWQKRRFQVIGGVFILLVLLIGLPSLIVANGVRGVYKNTLNLKEAVASKDLNRVQVSLEENQKALSGLEKSLFPLVWVKVVPWLGAYYSDAVRITRAGGYSFEAGQIMVQAVAPYADIIGFAGGQAGDGEKTAQDRIGFIVTTLDKIGPDIEKVGDKFLLAKKEVEQIDPNRYPEEFRGQKVRQPLSEMINLVEEVSTLTHDARPVLQVAPWLAGVGETRRYLVVFQNDAELRSTGGFITAYAILEVENGEVSPVLSEDIYGLDARYKPQEKAPEALVSYVPFPYSQDSRWRLRDMNLSPDFKVSMEIFVEAFRSASDEEFDGVVAVDTKFLTKLLAVLGEIGVPGWGNFSAEPDDRCDGCPQVVYELEKLADQPTNRIVANRKAMIGPLMHSILVNAAGSPKEKIPSLFNAVFTSLQEKHVLFYFPEEKIQEAMESFRIAGRIRDYEGDYFHLNDTSFSGAKANLFIKETVDQKIEISKDGKLVKTVDVTYKNPSPASDCNLERGGLCLNAPYRDWVRLYVPQGSKLVESSGFETEMKTYDELGKTVFEGFFGDKYPLRPLGQAKVSFKYELPFGKDKDGYKLLIQKQPGTSGYQYRVSFGSQEEEFELTTDKEIRFK